MWHTRSKLLRCLLWPLSLPFRLLVFLRRAAYYCKILKSHKIAAPVIVVGNLTVGGSGKTPLVVAIVTLLRRHGFKPGVVSRGYGGHTNYPCLLSSDSAAREVGDEPLLIYKLTGCSVVVDPNRVAAAKYLLAQTDCDVVVSDDGLQHYALARDIEILAINGGTRFGNELCLPVGPLREPLSRLKSVDCKVATGGTAVKDEIVAQLALHPVYNLQNSMQKLDPKTASVDAVAGIANPERFFTSLESLGFSINRHVFADHHQFTRSDLSVLQHPIVMTEKDAMRCADFTNLDIWALPIELELPEEFAVQLLGLLKNIKQH